VTAEVYSVSGAHVRTLAREGSFGPGTTELRWNGADDAGVSVASGVYFVRVRTAFGEHVARAVLLK
jgi:flagellar hook assembly protein FlgD